MNENIVNTSYNYLSKKTKRNKGEKDMYVIDDDHAPIISLEDFQMAQELRKQRS